MMRRALALIALLLVPLPAAAESVEWKAPPVGMIAAYDVDFLEQSVPVTQEIVAVNGDEVVMVSLPRDGSPNERYFRFLVSLESQGAVYGFDQSALLALWPLEVGKTAMSKVQATMQGQPIAFDWAAEVMAFEDLSVPAGTYRTVRIEHRLEAPGLLTLQTVTWLEAEWGFPVRTDTTIDVTGKGSMDFSMKLRELTGLN